MKSSPASEFSAELLVHLVELGVKHVVLAPGSRSQALALVAAKLEQEGHIELHVRIDERVAGFLALGISLETSRPVVVITTSGTAVANLHPAVLESHHAGVPLIVITADRPEELRGIGSNQTTNQKDFFGPSVRLSIDEPAPQREQNVTSRAHKLASELFSLSTDSTSPGPVHLNLGFREPLSSPIKLREPKEAPVSSQPRQGVHLELPRGPKTIVIAGSGAGEAAEELAHQGGWPLIAEVCSGSRYGRNLVPSYREVLAETELISQLERIIVFGHPTLSREVPALIANSELAIETIVVNSAAAEGYNPGHNVTAFVDSVSVEPGEGNSDWLKTWVTLGRKFVAEYQHDVLDVALATAPNVTASRSETIEDRKAFLAAELAASKVPVSRELLVDAVWGATWPHDRLVFGASRLIRVADRFVGGKKIPVFANRGLAGIDGTISTAIGIALASENALTRVVLGDLATLHDLGAMSFGFAERRPRIQVIVGNDAGGTIFDLLEVHNSTSPDVFDRVMLTPQNVDLQKLAESFGWSYQCASTVSEFERAITGAADGPELIEVKIPR